MAQKVGELEAELLLEIAEFVRNAKRAENASTRFTKNAAARFKTFGKVAGAGLVAAGAGLAAFAVQAVRLGSSAQETLNLLGETFGTASQDVIAFTEDLSKRTKLSRFELQSFAADLGALTVSLTGSRKEGAKLATQFTALAVDVGSLRELSTPDVILKFKSAIVGEAEAIKSLGVAMTETNLKNEALRQGFTKQFNELDEGAKVTIRSAIITRSLADAVGDFERTAGSLANQQKALTGQFKQNATVVGQELTPAVSFLAGELLNLISIVSDDEDALRNLVQKGVDVAIDAFTFLAIFGITVQKSFQGLKLAASLLGASLVKSFLNSARSVIKFGRQVEGLARAFRLTGLADTIDLVLDIDDSILALGEDLQSVFVDGIVDATAAIKELDAQQESLGVSVQKVKTELVKQAIEARKAGATVGQNKKDVQGVVDAINDLEKLKAFKRLAEDATSAAAAIQEFLTPTQLGVSTIEEAEFALMGIRSEMLNIAAAAQEGVGDIAALKTELQGLENQQAGLEAFVEQQRAAQQARTDERLAQIAQLSEALGAVFGAAQSGAKAAEAAFQSFAKVAIGAALDAAEKIALANAVQWATAAGASQAGVPLIGPGLAVAAATAAFAVARGFIQQLNQGGFVQGAGSRDTVPAMLTPGEFVIPAPAVRTISALLGQSVGASQGGGEVTSSPSSGITINMNLQPGEIPVTDAQMDNLVNRRIVPSLRRARARGAF